MATSAISSSISSATQESPLAQLIPYISQATSILLSVLAISARTLVSFIAKALHYLFQLSPHPIFQYLLAPIFVFFGGLLDVFVLTPCRILLYLLDAFYPVYVFLGVSCISGVLLGLLGRFIVVVLVRLGEEDPGLEANKKTETREQVTQSSMKKE